MATPAQTQAPTTPPPAKSTDAPSAPTGKSNQVTPERIMRLAWAFASPLVIQAGIENGIFDALDRGSKTAGELAAETGASERGIAAILGGLVAFELAIKQDDGRYLLAPDAASFLVRSKPRFYGNLIEHIHSSILPNWMTLGQITRSGLPIAAVDQPEGGAPFFESFVDALFPLNYPGARAVAEDFAAAHSGDNSDEPLRVLDLAAGSGVWGVAQAEVSPRVRVTALDLDPVLAVTRRTVNRLGLADRFDFLAGDLRTADLGSGYSLALLGHILHGEGAVQSRALLRRIFDALAPGGTVAVGEFLVNADRSGPAFSLIFAINMLVHTTEGNTFSFEEIGSWLKSIGFVNLRTLAVPAPSPVILADKPKN
jgi:SAM-dependent methyltransferase